MTAMFEFRRLCNAHAQLHAPSPASPARCAPGTNNYGASVFVVDRGFVCLRVCGVECDHAVALIDDAEYGNNCECGPVICGVC